MYLKNLHDPTPKEHLEALRRNLCFLRISKNVLEVFHMLGHHLTFHHNIIYIDLNTFAQLWFKHLSHYPLIGRPCIFQTKGHHFVVVVSCGNDKSCLFLII